MSENRAIPAETIPGDAVVHVGDDHVVLVPTSDGSNGHDLLASICATPSVEAFSAKLRVLDDDPPPEFALASWADGILRVLLRGEVAAQIYPTEGPPFQIEGSGLITWCEQRFDGVAAVALLAAATDLTDAVPASILQRRNRCGWVRVDTTSDAPPPPPPEVPPAPSIAPPASMPEPPSAPVTDPPEGELTEAEQHVLPEPDPLEGDGDPTAWPPPLPASGTDLAVEMLDLLGTTTTTDALRDLSAQALGTIPGPEGKNTAEPPPQGAPSPPAPQADEVVVPTAGESTPTNAPIAHTREFLESDEAIVTPPDVPLHPAAVPPPNALSPPESVEASPAHLPAATPPQAGLISTVPGMGPPQPTPSASAPLPSPPASHQPAGAPPPAPPHQPPAPAVPAAPSPGGSVPSVQAVRCDAGHPNPTHSTSCRSCGGPIQDRTIASISRPSMGWLVADDGSRVEISRPLLLGRNPSGVTHAPDGEPLAAISLPDVDQVLSRTHVEIRVVDWQVQVVDRDSRNGTFVTIPGRPPFRLHPGDPYPIPIGSRISLGDATTFTYRAGTD